MPTYSYGWHIAQVVEYNEKATICHGIVETCVKMCVVCMACVDRINCACLDWCMLVIHAVCSRSPEFISIHTRPSPKCRVLHSHNALHKTMPFKVIQTNAIPRYTLWPRCLLAASDAYATKVRVHASKHFPPYAGVHTTLFAFTFTAPHCLRLIVWCFISFRHEMIDECVHILGLIQLLLLL